MIARHVKTPLGLLEVLVYLLNCELCAEISRYNCSLTGPLKLHFHARSKDSEALLAFSFQGSSLTLRERFWQRTNGL